MPMNPRSAKTVTVGYDGTNNVLTLDPPTVTPGPGDWVEWDFKNVPAGVLPFIEFTTPSDPPPSFNALGPFQCLQLIHPFTVQGKGNIGVAGNYSYKAGLLGANSVLVEIQGGAVVNPTQAKNTSPVAVVKYVAPDINIDTNPLTLCSGDTVLWHVFDLPPNSSISFQFNLSLEDAALDPLVGPFKSLLVDRMVDGEAAGLMRILGINFTPDDRDQYTYHIALRDAKGNVLATHDPVIDNLGQPPGPPQAFKVKS